MNRLSLTSESSLAPFAERVQERVVGPCRLLMLQTPVPSVVTWKGSFKTMPDFAADEDMLQSLAVSLLDKGTHRMDRFEVAEILENRGAQVHFDSDGIYVDFAGRALSEDVSEVLTLVAEQLKEPLLDPSEFEKSRSRMMASIQRSLENTGSQALGALTRATYPRAHPNYAPVPAERMGRLAEVDVSAVRLYHSSHFGPNVLTLAVVGDFDPERIIETVRNAFEDWSPHDSNIKVEGGVLPPAGGTSIVRMPDKQNIDVRMGHALDLRRDDPDYVPLYLATYVLGGNFSARLMQVIRDEMGLTYGIRAGLCGISSDYSGHWQVGVTLSTELLDKGIEETLREVQNFVDGGVTEAELEDKKTTVVGSYKVGLATTSGLANSLLKNAERGFDLGYLDRFPEEVHSVTLERANEVVGRHVQPDSLHVAMAGTIPELTRSTTVLQASD